ncbi:hypothetical protein YSY43_45990 [Paenibacillus sp. YSY-4.3]
MASKTEHLNLLKKDPVADGNEYFNIETMLNENWDKIDEAVGYVQNRLNRSSTESITLQPGLQTINAKRDARFKLGEVRGRTLINLLGSWGGCESLNPRYFYNRVTASIDTTIKKSGSASLKVVADTSVDTTHYYRFAGSVVEDCYKVSEGENILFGAWIKPQSVGGAHMTLFFWNDTGTENVSGIIGGSVIYGDASKFAYGYVKAKVPAGARYVVPRIALVDQNGYENFTGTGAEGCNIDEVSIYKLSDTEYAALDGMTNEEVGARYPFVPTGIIGIENPYAITTSGNLLPVFYGWALINSPTSDGAYQIRASTNGTVTQLAEYWLPVISGATYSFSRILQNGSIQVYGFDAINGNPVQNMNQDKTNGFYKATFAIPSTVKVLRIRCYTDTATTESIFSNIMLNAGSEAKSFEPQRSSMLAFQTELHANPTNGSDPDVLFEQDGQYYKLAKWRKIVLDGMLEWTLNVGKTGFKQVRFPVFDGVSSNSTNCAVTKFNGSKLAFGDSSNIPDTFQLISSNRYFYVSIPNDDSGWPDGYNPTADEIKAYFWGWTMCIQDGSVPYAGTGTKYWKTVGKTGVADTSTLPTAQAPNRTPYQLLYRLAKETVEPVVSEGCLTIAEGDNMVEFGTGIVLRESVKPKLDGTGYWIAIDGTKIPSSASELRYKNNVVLGVYKNSMADFKWNIVNSVNAYGIQRAYLPTADYDQSAAYSVTYLKLDKSPIVPISGSLATNEKSQLNDLTAGVSEALHRVSVVEQKKAEKDAPGWITPTLLNGWTLSSSGVFPAQYFKDSMGIVHVKGIVTGGVTETVVFKLPSGYRPRITNRIPSIIMSGVNVYIAYLDVKASGDILAVFPTQSNHLTLNMSFLAEQ